MRWPNICRLDLCLGRSRRAGGGKLEPQALNDTNKLELRVFGDDDLRQAVLVARLDNLGKGASGAAVQNIRLMLGLAGEVSRPLRRW